MPICRNIGHFNATRFPQNSLSNINFEFLLQKPNETLDIHKRSCCRQDIYATSVDTSTLPREVNYLRVVINLTIYRDNVQKISVFEFHSQKVLLNKFRAAVKIQNALHRNLLILAFQNEAILKLTFKVNTSRNCKSTKIRLVPFYRLKYYRNNFRPQKNSRL